MNYPIVINFEGKYEAVLDKAYNIMLQDELLTSGSGYETLTFCISNHDKKRKFLMNEKGVELDGRTYTIKMIEDLKNGSNVCTVTCDAGWYDLNDGELKDLVYADRVTGTPSELITNELAGVTGILVPRTPAELLTYQLAGTGWTIGKITVTGGIKSEASQGVETVLHNLREICTRFGGDLYFDTKKKKVSLLANMGRKHQKIFCYEKNTSSIKRTIDTRDLFTRFTLIGKDADGNEVTVAKINDGKDYVENYSWFDKIGMPRKIKWYKKTDDRYSDKPNMLEYMTNWLAQYCKPVIGYELNLSLFEFTPSLGDYVFVYDKDLGIAGWLRVYSRKKNILQPHLSTVQLEAVKKTIVESIVSTSVDVAKTETQIENITADTILPAGTEDWIMQYEGGKWKAQPIVGAVLPIGMRGDVLQYDGHDWVASNVIGDINSVLDSINKEVY